MQSGRGTAQIGNQDGLLSRSHASIPTSSEEEGLELLGTASTTDDPDPISAHGEIDTRLLDYDSDTQQEDDAVSALDNTSATAMDTDQASLPATSPEMDATYVQCHAARTSSHKDLLISVSQDETFGKTVSVQSVCIGSLEDHGNLSCTFLGSRMMRGNETVNQSISSSIDPAKLICISCDTEHNIVGKDPIVVMLSDQNFVPFLNNTSRGCISVVRVENSSLLELYEMATEMFGNISFPEGSVFLVGSASHLSRSGTSLYAKDWTEVVALCTVKWRGVRICPLIPLITSECPGSIVRELCELTNWYSNVYDSNPLGFHEVWMEMVAAMEESSIGTTILDVMETYKLAMPSTLGSRTLDRPITFCSNNSRPVTCNGLPKDRCRELLGSLLNFLFDNFRACSRPETYLVRADANSKQSENCGSTVTLVGASNMGRSLAHFSDPCLSFDGITVAGWTPSPENVKQMIRAVEEKAKNSVAFVFDLLGNSSVRFEQFDGTTSLPFKTNGKYHLAGKVVTTPPEIFKKTVQAIAPIIQAKGSIPCIILPPLPRYLFARCCSDSSHCSNADDADYKSLLVSGFVRLKNELIKHLVGLGVTNFKVMDSGCVIPAAKNMSITDRLNELRNVTTSDGIHFTADGHKNMATRVTDCLKTLFSKPTKQSKSTTHFWRGFRSRRGSSLPRSTFGTSVWQGADPSRGGTGGRSRGGSHFRKPRGFHPYRKW
jgi:hypothetical protein